MKLPPVVTVRHVPNVQLPDLENPSFLLAHSDPGNVELSAEPAVVDTADVVDPSFVRTASSFQVPNIAVVFGDLGGSSAYEYDVIVTGDVVAHMDDGVSPTQHDEAPSQCHPQCCAGLGGEVLCLFEMENLQDVPITTQPDDSLAGQCVTPSSPLMSSF